jgi:hypothetical protein
MSWTEKKHEAKDAKWTGSGPLTKTIGIVVAALAASATGRASAKINALLR